MANRIIIDFYNPVKISSNNTLGAEDTIDSPLNDDILIDIQSEFQTVGDMIPSGISSIISLIRKGQGVGGVASASLEKLMNIPFWTKTNPIKLNVPLLFYMKNDVYRDVYEKAYGLSSLTAINVVNGKWKIPGISVSDALALKADSSSEQNQQTLKNIKKDRTSTIISLNIPNVIYLPYAIVYNAKATFSKEVVESKKRGGLWPLYARVDLEVRSLYPANTDMIEKIAGTGYLQTPLKDNPRSSNVYDTLP